MEKEKTPLFPLNKKSHYLIFCLLMVVILFFAFITATTLGSVDLSEESIGKVIINEISGKEVYEPDWEESTAIILWTIRIPRILTAFIVGAGLTLCGILMQVLTKNPLADPYVLGISHGASAGAVSVIMYGYLSFLGGYGTMVGAFDNDGSEDSHYQKQGNCYTAGSGRNCSFSVIQRDNQLHDLSHQNRFR